MTPLISGGSADSQCRLETGIDLFHSGFRESSDDSCHIRLPDCVDVRAVHHGIPAKTREAEIRVIALQ